MMKLSEELLYALVQHLNIDGDRNTLVALSTTSRVLSDAALDILWTTPNLWILAKRMDEAIWEIQETDETLTGRTGTRRVLVSASDCSPRQRASC
jgi:hypothetical protein